MLTEKRRLVQALKQNGVKVACEPLEERRKLSRAKRASALTALSAGQLL